MSEEKIIVELRAKIENRDRRISKLEERVVELSKQVEILLKKLKEPVVLTSRGIGGKKPKELNAGEAIIATAGK